MFRVEDLGSEQNWNRKAAHHSLSTHGLQFLLLFAISGAGNPHMISKEELVRAQEGETGPFELFAN